MRLIRTLRPPGKAAIIEVYVPDENEVWEYTQSQVTDGDTTVHEGKALVVMRTEDR